MKAPDEAPGRPPERAPERAIDALPDAEADALLSPVEERPRIDLRDQGEPWERRFDAGVAMRATLPHAALADWRPADDRADAVAIVRAAEAGRQQSLLPLRRERMAASPFAFLRGAAGVMAADLASLPVTGIDVVVNGDAHIANFGLFGTPTGDVVLDLNDFDEVAVGPWEHDLLRLAASIAVAGDDAGLDADARADAVRAATRGYRTTMARLAPLGALDVWSEATHLDRHADGRVRDRALDLDEDARDLVLRAVAKARGRTSRHLLKRVGERRVDGGWRIRADPPVTTLLDSAEREAAISALERYAETLPRERRYMLQRYRAVDAVHRVVGVGSVGLRAHLALLFGNSDHDALFLQIKEAVPPAARAHLPPQPAGWGGHAKDHEGERVVHGQRLLQAVGDPLLGWTSLDGRPCYVRQMRNQKGEIALPWERAGALHAFLNAYGALLARAHARTGDAAAIAGWCGDDGGLDDAVAVFAACQAKLTARDHAAYAAAC